LQDKDFVLMAQEALDRTQEKNLIEQQHRREICNIGRRMYQKGLVVAAEGNLSVRLDAQHILVTPAGSCKGRLTSKDLLVTDMCGRVVRGAGLPSSEIQMHLLYYRLRPDLWAVCHAHPPTATGFAAAGRPLESAVLPEVIVDLGKIPLAPYGTPGTLELCAGLEPLVRNCDAILLENHGVVTSGPDLRTAYQRMETVEQFARVMLTAELLGGAHLLPRAEVQKLINGRPRYGDSRPGETLDLPVTAGPSNDRVGVMHSEFLEEAVHSGKTRQ
jgi:L-fuculose-phosphate aldolase